MSRTEFRDLREFLEQLRRDGDLAVVEATVDSDQEVAEIHRRVIAAGGPALFFNAVRDAHFPLVTNLFGTRRRAELAFGRRPMELIRRLVELAEEILPPTAGKIWSARDVGWQLLKVGFKNSRSAPVTERVSEPGLERLPVLTSWPDDGGPFVTLPLVYSEHPRSHGHNLGMYRLQVYDRSTTGMHWQIGKGGGFHFAEAERNDEALPVTVFLGGPPALILSAIAPLPENVPELLLASLLAGRRLEMTRVNGRRVLGRAEFALLGHVPPGERRAEGPFGDHYGYYSLQHDFPVFRVEQMLHRKDAIYPATVVGKPRQEDFFIGDLLQELLSPLFPLVMPAVEDLWSYGETGYHSLAAGVVKQRYKREAVASGFRILGEGQLSLTKFLMLTDQKVDLRSFKRTLTHLLERTDFQTDLYVFSNLSMDTLDYTGPRLNEGSKGLWLGLGDPKRRLPGEFHSADLPRGVSAVEVFCPGCLVLQGPRFTDDSEQLQQIAAHPAFSEWPLLVLSDDARRAVASEMNFLWTTFTRFEPAADIHAAARSLARNHICYQAPLLIDARMKPWYPAELSCRPDIAQRVSERWQEYFPDGVEMGDSESGHLTP